MNRNETEHQNLYHKNRKKRNDNNNGRNYLLIIICTLLFYYGCYSSAATYVNRQIGVGQVQGIACMYPLLCFDGVGEDPVDHRTKNITKYLSGEYISEKEELSSNEIIEEYLLTNLRLEDGFLLSDFKNKFGKDFLEEYKDKIETLKKDNLVVIENDIFKVTDQGMLLLNRVLVTLL